MKRIYAIGDIHGRLDLLQDLISQISLDNTARGAAETELIFLGDLVDRGPESAGVIDRLISLKKEGWNTQFILGNHDEVFLNAASGDEQATRFLVRIGGKETILSYGVSEEEYRAADFPTLTALLVNRVPTEHLEFLRSFSDYSIVGDYVFVHAGIRPGIAITEQRSSDLRWIRSEFLECSDSHGAMIVHGHSISRQPMLRRNRIGIDTGAFASGQLTAVGLQSSSRWFVTAKGAPDPRWGDLPTD